jgi:uncharacterized membrane protein (UPF0127 family)
MVKNREKDQPKARPDAIKRKSKGKRTLFVALLMLVLFIIALIYNPNKGIREMINKSADTSSSTSSEPGFVKQGELSFLKADGSILSKIDIEIAADEGMREQGLMYRRHMAVNCGMLFIFDDEDLRSFWMKNTYLPLDILYVNSKSIIVKIWENVATLNEQPIPSDFPAKYVIEVNAGYCALNRIAVGDRMTFIRN